MRFNARRLTRWADSRNRLWQHFIKLWWGQTAQGRILLDVRNDLTLLYKRHSTTHDWAVIFVEINEYKEWFLLCLEGG